MPWPDDDLGRIEALLEVAGRLAAAAPSARILMAKLSTWFDSAPPRASAAPLPVAEVERILREAWEADPREELDALEAEPAATGATAQVHRATLEGRPVAVKVLRPGVAAMVRRDLVLLDGLLTPLGAAFPRLDGPVLLREARERILDELDLEHEAQIQRRVSRALRNHPQLTVPAPVTRLAHEQVLVSDWVEGTPLLELPSGSDRATAAATLARFALGGLREGFAHAGVDPADVLLTPDGRVAILDFGATAAVDPRRAEHALAAVEAFAQQDGAAFGAALEALGLLDAAHGPAALELLAHGLGPLGQEGSSVLDRAALERAGQRIAERRGAALELLLAGRLPAEDLWAGRTLAQLLATLARAGVAAPWRELVLESLRDGWTPTRA